MLPTYFFGDNDWKPTYWRQRLSGSLARALIRLTCKSFNSGSLARALFIRSLAKSSSLARALIWLTCKSFQSGSLARAFQYSSLARAFNYSLARVFNMLTCKSFQSSPTCPESASSAGGGCSVVPVIHPRQWRLVARGGWSMLPVIPLPFFTTNLASTYIALTANLQVVSLTFPLGKVCRKSSLNFWTLAKNVGFCVFYLFSVGSHHLVFRINEPESL